MLSSYIFPSSTGTPFSSRTTLPSSSRSAFSMSAFAAVRSVVSDASKPTTAYLHPSRSSGSSLTASSYVSHALAWFAGTLKSLQSTVGRNAGSFFAFSTYPRSASTLLTVPRPGFAFTQQDSSVHSSLESSSYMNGMNRSSMDGFLSHFSAYSIWSSKMPPRVNPEVDMVKIIGWRRLGVDCLTRSYRSRFTMLDSSSITAKWVSRPSRCRVALESGVM